MYDVDEEIREIKKEIIESRGLTIKTNNLVNALGADVKSIAKRQAGYERRFNWNGAVFLTLVAFLSFVGLKFASDARISEIEASKSDLEHRVSELQQELEEETRRAEERTRAEAKALGFYKKIEERQRAEVVGGFTAILKERLSPTESAFFTHINDRFRMELAVENHQNALELIRTGRYAEAADKLRDALEYAADTPNAAEIRYAHARALRKLGRQAEARIEAERVLDEELGRELHDDATFLMALCYEELGELERARDTLRTFMRRWPRSPLMPDIRTRMRDVMTKIRARRSAGKTAKK